MEGDRRTWEVSPLHTSHQLCCVYLCLKVTAKVILLKKKKKTLIKM